MASNYTKKRKATLASSIIFNSFNKTPGTIKTSGKNCVVMITQEEKLPRDHSGIRIINQLHHRLIH